MRTIDVSRDPRTLEEILKQRASMVHAPDSSVLRILDDVRREGDIAVHRYTAQFDSPRVGTLGLRVAKSEIDDALRRVPRAVRAALRLAKRNITAFHRRQIPRSWTMRTSGAQTGQRFLALDRVGIYVPGGKAAYPSTVLMNAIPAKVAGVREIAMCTPCGQDGSIAPEILAAAAECGVGEIYRVGGAQAIAAMAYGTESIRRVDKITGPGNRYVAEAKRLVFGSVGIDSVAGPTEVVVVADRSANAEYVAADLIAQAEHDQEAMAVCISNSSAMLLNVEAAVERQLQTAGRKEIAAASLERNGLLVLVRSLAEAVGLVNQIAPEHCELLVKRPETLIASIRTAGALFVGPWSTEALGDYVAGPNHTLPTAGTARFSSALSVMDFLRFTTIVRYTRPAFNKIAPVVEVLATAEGLHGHAASIRIRREEQ